MLASTIRLLMFFSELIVDAKTILHIGTKILDHHVGFLDHSLEGGYSLRRLQIERHAAFVALKILKIGAFARATRALAVDEMWWRLDLDDVGTPIAELTNAGRPRANASEIKHGKAGKGLGGPGKRHFDGSGVAISTQNWIFGLTFPDLSFLVHRAKWAASNHFIHHFAE